eukprot:412041_1
MSIFLKNNGLEEFEAKLGECGADSLDAVIKYEPSKVPLLGKDVEMNTIDLRGFERKVKSLQEEQKQNERKQIEYQPKKTRYEQPKQKEYQQKKKRYEQQKEKQ